MERKLSSWFSPSLQKEMPIAVYGHYGLALLMIPTASADYLEYERFNLINAIAPYIESGKVKVFSVDSINNESWMNKQMDPRHKSIRHQQWNDYIYREVIPFIKTHTSAETPIIVCGASFGALHAANLFFKRPDLLNGFIAMSGVYDLTEYTNGYFDEDVYYNSPAHYLPNLADHGILEQIRNSHHLHILSGSGAYEDPDAARRLAGILYNKGIWYELDIWGTDMKHDWPTWLAMLPHYLGTRF
ncbi:esterase family protein [Flavihumibacter stibioxidans]|uniref:Esterase n=1 Tax=Flavihumibacter stibioxidans TaxID=1834163 RepID=A0ABR7MDS1_9BACT|nr:alpha/beta hydrolase-fold protein [Flavihumibacter stibioxidans]MBC6493168.1 esterase [Flavihumibacter stibioxidans]